jgi:hypothetical protein
MTLGKKNDINNWEFLKYEAVAGSWKKNSKKIVKRKERQSKRPF